MNLTLAYRNRSSVISSPAGLAVALAGNLRRDRVSFDAELRHPLRFREAIGALHDVLIGDLRQPPRHRSSHKTSLAEKKVRETAIHPGGSAEEFARLDALFRQKRREYWSARDEYSRHLRAHDPKLWRILLPSDPVVTVAPDVLFLEGFSADESSYACLTVDRNAFAGEGEVRLGTTNVDYSWTLHENFQLLRSYRPTRLQIDPGGLEVAATDQGTGPREEKIDLPDSWLRGFSTLQSAMSLPMRRVPLTREALYNILAFLKRHRAARSPRAIRFELSPGRPVAIVLEPWEKRIEIQGLADDGSRAESIRVWGRDRLLTLARLLPILDEAEVYLLGSGLPSFWSIRMGGTRLLLGLSGWTANDWTGGRRGACSRSTRSGSRGGAPL